VLHLIVILAFAGLKLFFVATRNNTAIAVFDKFNQHQSELEGIDLDENNVYFAISISDVHSGKIKHDPKHVNWRFVVWYDGEEE